MGVIGINVLKSQFNIATQLIFIFVLNWVNLNTLQTHANNSHKYCCKNWLIYKKYENSL